MSEAKLRERLLAVIETPFGGRGLTPVEEETATLASRGMTYEQMAEEMGVTVDGIYFRLVRANKKLETTTGELTGIVFQKLIRILEEK